MTTVVGFEGELSQGFHATWGTAALKVGNRLLNPTSGLQAPWADASRLANDGQLHLFSREITIADREATNPLVVVAVNPTSRFRDFLVLEKGRHGGVITIVRLPEVTALVVRNTDALRLYSRDVAHGIISRVLSAPDSAADPNSAEIVRAGLALDPNHPYLNALRAHLSNRGETARRLARACVRGDRGFAAFDEFYNALTSGKKNYELRYEGGVAEGGGLDVDHARTILKGVVSAVKSLAAEIRHDFPFLPKSAAPRLVALVPGSARLQFASNIENHSMGDRVARYLELRSLERALQGDAPEAISDSPGFDTAITAIVRPSLTIETKLSQKPFEDSEPMLVTLEEPTAGTEVTDELFCILGVFTGALSDSGKVELRVFPGSRGRLLLSTNDDGEGQTPAGLEFLAGKQMPLHRLVIADLLRRTDRQGRERFFIRGLRVVQENHDDSINAVPSCIVRGAYLAAGHIDVRLSASGQVEIGSDTVDGFANSQPSAYSWLIRYRDMVRNFELSYPSPAWYPAVRPPRPSTLERTLISLAGLGGKADANELAEEVSRRFETISRVNNTRREAIRHPDLLEYADEARKVVALSSLGQRYAEVYRKAGGDCGLDRMHHYRD